MKSKKSADKPKLEQGRKGLGREMTAPTQAQSEVQIKEENQTREQAVLKQIEGIQTPLARQNTDRHIKTKTRDWYSA